MERIVKVLMIGLVGSCLFGCSSKVTFGLNRGRVKESRSRIDKVIAEPERRAEIHAVVDSYVAAAGKLADEVKAIRQQIVEKNQDYDATREELQKLYDQLGDNLDQLVDSARDHSMELRKLCSEEEWEEIFDNDDDIVNFKY